ncbi:MAG: hypothetical protein ABW105_07885 [Candidatus Thiodiazotropha sp. 6PLUC1]
MENNYLKREEDDRFAQLAKVSGFCLYAGVAGARMHWDGDSSS